MKAHWNFLGWEQRLSIGVFEGGSYMMNRVRGGKCCGNFGLWCEELNTLSAGVKARKHWFPKRAESKYSWLEDGKSHSNTLLPCSLLWHWIGTPISFFIYSPCGWDSSISGLSPPPVGLSCLSHSTSSQHKASHDTRNTEPDWTFFYDYHQSI